MDMYQSRQLALINYVFNCFHLVKVEGVTLLVVDPQALDCHHGVHYVRVQDEMNQLDVEDP
jgi:hypothetical protein